LFGGNKHIDKFFNNKKKLKFHNGRYETYHYTRKPIDLQKKKKEMLVNVSLKIKNKVSQQTLRNSPLYLKFDIYKKKKKETLVSFL
jgi:hypothetical protein